MAWDNNAERKEHTRESAEVTISLDKRNWKKSQHLQNWTLTQ